MIFFSKFRFPLPNEFRIDDGKISGQSYQLPSIGTFWSNSEEGTLSFVLPVVLSFLFFVKMNMTRHFLCLEFSKSLKYLLTDIKVIVAWLSDH
jgi:hypothetical protein